MDKLKMKELNELRVNTRIAAIIRYRKTDKTEDVILTVAEDGFYVNDSSDELSYNWNIVDWKII